MALKAKGLMSGFYEVRSKDILSSRFLLPPFTVLNTREGFWQDRKRQWIAMGIKSELGRGYTEEGTAYGTSLGKSGELNKKYRDASPGGSPRPAMNNKNRPYGAPIQRGDGRGRPLAQRGLTYGVAIREVNGSGMSDQATAFKQPGYDPANYDENGNDKRRKRLVAPGGSPLPAAISYQVKAGMGDGRKLIRGDGGSGQAPADPDEDPIGGTSIFDPVLCELAYRWFCPPGGLVVDPFAGGSVRGIVAGELGYEYIGVDLSATQVAANKKQALDLGTMPEPRWICGDSIGIQKLILDDCGMTGQLFDFCLTCPPYGDLEVYSQDPRDISNMPLAAFNEMYAKIIKETAALLKPNSMACVVVGDYRDKDGFYCNLPGVTIAAFEAAGMRLYNEAILVNVTGSLPLRINKQFGSSRKLGKCHQNVYVFAKGNPREFVKDWPPLEIK